MAKIKLLVDTDVIIDFLKGIRAAKDLFRSDKFILYCSIQSRKELVSKAGLKDSERKSITEIFSSKVKVLKIDKDISDKFSLLIDRYGENPASYADYVVAATSWSKKLPLLTRNRKHFEHIREVIFCPGYVYEKDE